MLADVFIVSLGALINQNKFQCDSSSPSWYKFEIEFTIEQNKKFHSAGRLDY